jgi:hypothetical protein
MGNVQLDKALGILEIVVLPVVLLPFAIEEFKGFCIVFLLVVSSPIFDDVDDPVWHDHTGFFDDTRVDAKDLVCALAIASGAKEYPRESARAHSVGNGWIIVGFNVGSKGGLAVFFEMKFATEDNLVGGVFVSYPSSRWEAIQPENSKVDKVYNNLVGELSIWEVRHECATALLNDSDVALDFSNVFVGRSSV